MIPRSHRTWHKPGATRHKPTLAQAGTTTIQRCLRHPRTGKTPTEWAPARCTSTQKSTGHKPKSQAPGTGKDGLTEGVHKHHSDKLHFTEHRAGQDCWKSPGGPFPYSLGSAALHRRTCSSSTARQHQQQKCPVQETAASFVPTLFDSEHHKRGQKKLPCASKTPG